jgi:mannose-6-phosphate isomerase
MSPAIAATLLPPNLVWRSYPGGSVLRSFRALPPAPDNHFPEDWLASTVQARNGENSAGPGEGLSFIGANGSRMLLRDLFASQPEFWFGAGHLADGGNVPGVLWKLLDSSVRLQFQAHPDATFARARLNSSAGKTECWYILSTRGDACVYLGFQRPPTRGEWAEMIREQQVDRMLGCFDGIPVQAGDCYVVPAGTPHAIGAGVFMVELMEPTDWVVRCEVVTAGLALSPDACFMGLGLDACLDIFDYSAYTLNQVRERFQQHPRVLREGRGLAEEELIAPDWHRFFRLHRIRANGSVEWPGRELMLLIIVKGEGELSAGAQPCCCKQGETWLLPGAAESWNWTATDSELLLLKLPIRKEVMIGKH